MKKQDNFDFDLLTPNWQIEYPNYKEVLREAIKHARKRHGIGRDKIADQLSQKNKFTVTENMINKWTKENGEGNRFPMELASDLAEITRDPRVILYHPASCGIPVLTPEQFTAYKVYECRQQEVYWKTKADLLEQEMRN